MRHLLIFALTLLPLGYLERPTNAHDGLTPSSLNWKRERVDERRVKCAAAYTGKDYRKALQVCLSLAEEHEPFAEQVIGVMYAHGLGVSQDLGEAYYWLRIGASDLDAKDYCENKVDLLARYLTVDELAYAIRRAQRYFGLHSGHIHYCGQLE